MAVGYFYRNGTILRATPSAALTAIGGCILGVLGSSAGFGQCAEWLYHKFARKPDDLDGTDFYMTGLAIN